VPELVAIKTKDYEFVVRTKEVSLSQQRLKRTLRSRGKTSSPSYVLLSPALAVKDKDQAVSKHELDGSVFFENKQYEIEFFFDKLLTSSLSVEKPYIEHRLKAVEDSFYYSQRSNSLRATINTGNDIGWFKFELVYQIDQEKLRQSFSFEVLPTKMDMTSDLAVINEAIDSQYPLWRFSLAEKTQQQMKAVKKPHPQFLLLWLAQFESLLSDLQRGLRHIVNAPHSRLMSTSRSVKMDRLKGKLSPKLEQNVMLAKADGNLEKRFHLNNKKLSVDTPENRFIKSVITTSISKLSKISHAAKKMESNPDKQRLSNSFFDKLDTWQQDIRLFQRQPLFREVGSFKGLRRESLVLQQKPGYAKVYKAWQQLKWYLDLLEGDSSLSLRSVSELYEVWCFLEIRRIILSIGFEEVANSKIQMLNNGVDASFKDGMQGSFEFRREDEVTLRLAHEPIFSTKGKKLKSWITTQKPDIYLEVNFSNDEKIVWLFDAKYRIKKPAEFQDVNTNTSDEVPDDAINQMHRYRDALIQQEINTEGDMVKTRPVFGAYALYPGYFDQCNEENPYKDAINEIGIGAFSLLPSVDNGGSIWLTDFLTKQLNPKSTPYSISSPDRHFVEEAPRIPYQGTRVSRYNDLVIAANQLGPSRDADYVRNFDLGIASFYHTKQLAFERQRIEFHIIKEARYLSVAVDDATGNHREISFIYPILKADRVKRKEITFAQSGTNNLVDPEEVYWLFELGSSLKLIQSVHLPKVDNFVLKLSGRESLSSSSDWSDLEERYIKG
jgi:hypothetical protein